MSLLLQQLVFLCCCVLTTWTSGFSPSTSARRLQHSHKLSSTAVADDGNSQPISESSLDQLKLDLIRLCGASPDTPAVRIAVDKLEETAERMGIGQASAVSDMLSGTWELLYASTEITRSSPFFWAFRQAFPDQADQIFDITDAIPAPLKETGPAYQELDLSSNSFVSRVKVATLGGLATSIMTTRATIVATQGVDSLLLRIETTKPADSTVVQTLFGPLATTINDNSPAFPSGQTLERVVPGSSEVTLRTSFCDEGLRISYNTEGDIFVWKRSEFATYNTL